MLNVVNTVDRPTSTIGHSLFIQHSACNSLPLPHPTSSLRLLLKSPRVWFPLSLRVYHFRSVAPFIGTPASREHNRACGRKGRATAPVLSKVRGNGGTSRHPAARSSWQIGQACRVRRPRFEQTVQCSESIRCERLSHLRTAFRFGFQLEIEELAYRVKSF